MQLEQALESVVGFMVPSEVGRFREHVDPAWRSCDASPSIESPKMLDLSLPSPSGQSIAESSLAQARTRLGEDPLAYLFTVTADRWATESAGQAPRMP